MISDHEQLAQSRKALAILEDAFASLRDRVGRQNPALFSAMVQDYAVNIRTIRREIDEYLGIEADTSGEVPLWMVIEHGGSSGRDISSRLLSEWLSNFRKALFGVTSYLDHGLVRGVGRPDASLLGATDPQVLALQPGSIRIGLRLPASSLQTDVFVEPSDSSETPPERALRYLLELAQWASSGSITTPLDTGWDVDRLAVVARFAIRIAPSRRSAVTSVSFSGRLVPSGMPLRLRAESAERLKGLVRLLSHVSEETVIGQIREIDLDARRVILRERGDGMPDLKCIVPDELIEAVAGYLDRQVRVSGVISSASPDTVNVRSIELIDLPSQ